MDFFSLLKYFIIGMNFVIIFVLKKVRDQATAKGRTENAKKKCLVAIAHPDDESMFFLPLIENLKHQGYAVHLLCFSNGNSAIREDELGKAASFLNIDRMSVLDLTSKGIVDGMKNEWSTSVVREALLAYIKEESTEGVFTFDSYGVSGHLNHIAIHKAVAERPEDFTGKKVYFLKSLPILKKYFPPIEFAHILAKEFWSLVREITGRAESDKGVFRFYNWNAFRVWTAMSLHYSQFVWFRKLFVLFSSYGFVNEFTLMRQ
jgi:N-acetylglucosaminylphosphatidylinositol deacetylase